MKTQHTPGPWKIERVGAAGFPQIVCRDHAKFDGAVIATEICNGEANARLISAAPELLEACKAAKEYCGKPFNEINGADAERVYKLCAEAIAAAEGN